MASKATKAAPKRRSGLPTPPPGFNAAQRKLWNDVVTSRPAKEWTPTDVNLIRLYCQSYSDVQTLDEQIEAEGEVIQGAKGVVMNPLVRVRSMRETLFIQCSQRLKLNPSNRYTNEQAASAAKQASAANSVSDFIGDDPDGLLNGWDEDEQQGLH